jgi:hypothetical protein
MDLSSLASLGKVAGLGGIALGVVVLLVRPVIDRTSGVPAAQREPLLRFIAMGAFGIGALGIVAWLVSSLVAGGSVAVTAGAGGLAGGRDVSGNKVTIAAPLTQPSAPDAKSGGNESGGMTVTAGPGGLAGGRDVSGNTLEVGVPQTPAAGSAPSMPGVGKPP